MHNNQLELNWIERVYNTKYLILYSGRIIKLLKGFNVFDDLTNRPVKISADTFTQNI